MESLQSELVEDVKGFNEEMPYYNSGGGRGSIQIGQYYFSMIVILMITLMLSLKLASGRNHL